MTPGATLAVTVAWVAPGIEELVPVAVAAGTTVAEAIERSGLAARHGLDADTLEAAIHGRRTTPSATLQDGDRIEILRPLVVDPKEARRRRAGHVSPQRKGPSGPP